MKRGDIVLATVPHTTDVPAKVRPALVVQSDYYNLRIANVLLATITSNLSRQLDAAHYLIDIATAEGRNSGLNCNSLVSCLNLAVLPKANVGAKIGELPPTVMLQIDQCLKVALGIP